MSSRAWVPKVALLWAAASVPLVSCGGKLLPLPGHRDAGVEDSGPEDAGVDADGGRMPDGAPTDERGPPPVPTCVGENAMCLPPDAGVVWTGASVIKCQPENYVGPWTLILERLIAGNFQVVQKQVVQEPGFGWTFYDTSGPPAELTYRVCAVIDSMTSECGQPFKTGGPSNCECEPTTCELQKECMVKLDDQCGGTIDCGGCSGGMQCDPMTHSCCPPGFMGDGWGGCVCAPKGCPLCAWDTTTCSCSTCNVPLPL